MSESTQRSMADQSASTEMDDGMAAEMKKPMRDDMDEDTGKSMKPDNADGMDKKMNEGTKGEMDD
jgi:hypothetical protein